MRRARVRVVSLHPCTEDCRNMEILEARPSVDSLVRLATLELHQETPESPLRVSRDVAASVKRTNQASGTPQRAQQSRPAEYNNRARQVFLSESSNESSPLNYRLKGAKHLPSIATSRGCRILWQRIHPERCGPRGHKKTRRRHRRRRVYV